MSDEFTKLLFELQSKVSATHARFEDFSRQYEAGRTAQIGKAQDDQKNFEVLKTKLDDVHRALDQKLDRAELEPLLAKKARFILILLLVLSSLGVVTLKTGVGETFRTILGIP